MPPPKKLSKAQQLRHQFNSAWSLVTFHNASTKEVLEHLGITAKLPFALPDKGLTWEDFTKIKEYVLAEPEPDFDELYHTKDFLVESETPQHQRDSRQLIHDRALPYLPARNPAQKAELLYFQQEAAELAMYQVLGPPKMHGFYLRAKTGTGKTYFGGQFIRWMKDIGYVKDCLSPYPIAWFTKASIVDQTTEDLENEFGLTGQDVLILNYEALATTKGRQLFIDVEVKIEHGEEVVYYTWNPVTCPWICIFDEAHTEKNPGSKQFRLRHALNDMEKYPFVWDKLLQVRMSASPFSRLVSATNFVVSTRMPYSYGLHKTINNKTVRTFIADIAAPAKPEEYSRPAIRKLLKRVHPYILGFKNVRQKFTAHNRVEYMDFDNHLDQEDYNKCMEEYLERIAKIRGNQELRNSEFQELVALMVMQMKAEIIRCRTKAPRLMYEAVRSGKAAVMACKYIASIAKCLMQLHNDYGVTREEVSLIWGGDAALANQNEKPKYTKEYIQALIKGQTGEEITEKILKDILKYLQLEQNGLTEIPPEMDLGKQSRKQRWREIKRFQGGPNEPQITRYCFFTFGAGGAGLSLHHRYPHTLQREMFASPVWNEMDWLQAFGRCDRINMLSDVTQSALLYKGTIEPAVYGRCVAKGQCLNEVVQRSDMNVSEEMLAKILAMSEVMIDEDDDERGDDLFDEIDNNPSEYNE